MADDLARRIAEHFISNAPYYEDKAFHHPETTLDEAAETVRIMLAPLLAAVKIADLVASQAFRVGPQEPARQDARIDVLDVEAYRAARGRP